MEWIDVNDRMPDHNGDVLVCCMGNDEPAITIGVQWVDGETTFVIYELESKSDEVTHWMELPKLPEVKQILEGE